MAAGDFSPTQLVDINLKIEESWGDAQIRKTYEPKAESLQAIRSEQTARLDALQDPNKDNTVKVKWLDARGIVASTVAIDECNIDGVQLESKSQDMSLDGNIYASFAVTEENFRTNQYEMAEVVALGLLQAQKVLAEKANQMAIAKIDSFTGVNQFAGAGTIGTFNATSGDTDIAAANFGSENLFPYLAQAAVLNRYQDGYIIDGGNLWKDYYLAAKQAMNADGKLPNELFKDVRPYFDLFNLAAAGVSSKTYLIDKGAVGFFTKSRFDASPRVLGHKTGQTRYSIPVAALTAAGKPEVRADVIYTNLCAGNDIKHVWQLILRQGTLLNPVIGNAALTGVLSFNKTA